MHSIIRKTAITLMAIMAMAGAWAQASGSVTFHKIEDK